MCSYSLSGYDSFIAFSRVTAIETVHMSVESGSSHNAPYEKIELADRMRNVIDLTFDYKEKRYFFSDIQQGNIKSVTFSGTDVKQVVRGRYLILCPVLKL